MKRIGLVLGIVLLAGCSSLIQPPSTKKPPVTVVEPGESEKESTVSPLEHPEISIETTQIENTDISPVAPKLPTVGGLESAVEPLVEQMLTAKGVSAGKVLLVDSVKNSTNGALDMPKATAALTQLISSTGRFNIVPASTVSNARKALGLSQNDNLVTRSKAVGLGRYVKADYVLYSVVSGNKQNRHMAIQLLLVQTGEILWSGRRAIE